MPLRFHFHPRLVFRWVGRSTSAHPAIARNRTGLQAWISLLLACLLTTTLHAAHSRGLPPSRVYSFDEIGELTRNAHIGFDSLGRLTVIDAGSLHVLNDGQWLQLHSQDASLDRMQELVADSTGRMFYGGLGTWGEVIPSPTGVAIPRRLTPDKAPDWVRLTEFNQIVPCHDAVYFANWNGVVRWDRKTGTHLYFPRAGISRLFELNGEVYVSAHGHALARVNVANATLENWSDSKDSPIIVDNITPLDAGTLLISTSTRQLLTFNGRTLTPWPNELATGIKTKITSLCRLQSGTIALAISGRGLYMLSPGGEVLEAFTTAEYHRIRDIVTRGDGCCWLTTETGIIKMLHDSAVRIIDQRLGLSVLWPQIVSWKGRTVIASNGRLYEEIINSGGAHSSFRLLAGQPRSGAWGIAATTTHLLVANNEGVWASSGTGAFTQVLANINASRLVVRPDQRCYVIGESSIALLESHEGGWRECAPRVRGAGYPNIVHAAGSSAWVELGANRVLRISYNDGMLDTSVMDKLFERDGSWSNIGVIGPLVVISGSRGNRLVFDENQGAFVQEHPLTELFASTPEHLTRIRQSEDGALWACHENGVNRYTFVQGKAVLSDRYLQEIPDKFPMVQLPGNGEVWVSSARALYHVSTGRPAPLRPSEAPRLASLADARTGLRLDLMPGTWRPHTGLLRVPYDRNSLTFRFFAPTHNTLRSARHEYRLSPHAQAWAQLGEDSTLSLPSLREGSYDLEVRSAGSGESERPTLSLRVVVTAPWYRSPLALAAFLLAVLILGIALYRWLLRGAARRNARLEQLVHLRTAELKQTMAKLEAETRNAATLEERQRLAGEIHDSVQQGLSGLILQIDGTLRHGNVDTDLRTRLGVIRNMVAFTRQEVQHAVWDLESPLLAHESLGDALRRLASFIGSGTPRIEVEAGLEPDWFTQSLRHHLLRISQEAMTNAVRHSNATQVLVSFIHDGERCTLLIRDNGKGFDQESSGQAASGHFGLRGMHARADKMNASLSIQSSPGNGTTITVELTAPHTQQTLPS